MFQNMYGYQYNGYQNQYMQQSQQITKVNGENGARAYQLPPNSSVILLDESAPLIWVKVTDGAGYPVITPYKIAPVQQEAKADYNSLEKRIEKLEEMIREQSNITDAKCT